MLPLASADDGHGVWLLGADNGKRIEDSQRQSGHGDEGYDLMVGTSLASSYCTAWRALW